MGLIQRSIEAEGISTISISLSRIISQRVKPPRALLVDFPLGHPMGLPFHEVEQRQILTEALNQLIRITVPGSIVDLTWAYSLEGTRCEICTVEVVNA